MDATYFNNRNPNDVINMLANMHGESIMLLQISA